MCSRVVLTTSFFALLTLATAKLPVKEIPARIPEGINPTFYDLLIHPHLSEGTFSGTVNIQFNLTSSIKFIPVHQHGLTILRTDVVGPKGKVAVKEAYKIKALEYWLVEPLEMITPGSYNITMTFTGNMKNKMSGLYRSAYAAPNSSALNYLSSTKFEPTYARQSFPCFDEPLLKAKYKVRVIRPKDGGYHALGNSEIVSETPGPAEDEVVVEYKETPPVSTYLIAYVVSNFKTLGPVTIENSGEANFSLQVWSAPHLTDQTTYARHIASQTLSYFIKYFDIPYPLPKMDFIAIPDFSSGAMENWGLVTFRETDLLTSNETGMLAAKFKIAHVSAHELAHQWFGNLVTMKWWSDIWLNEGFARFMQFKGVLEGTAEGSMWKGDLPSIEEVTMAVMIKDSLISSHAVINNASSPNAITQVFDSISYGKGSAVLNMIEHLLGKEKFMNGIRKYLKSHQFGNAESSDLWAALSEVSGLPLTYAMETWLMQPGYPILNVRRTKKTVHITQRRFMTDIDKPFPTETSPFEFKWDIPIIYRTAQSENERVAWLYRNMSELVLEVGKSSPWIKLNYKYSGFYRVNYDEETWLAIIQQLDENHTMFTPEDRADILDDAFALGMGGYIPVSVPLEIIRVYLKKETARLPLVTGLHRLTTLSSKLEKSQKQTMKVFKKEVISTLYNKVIGHIDWDFSKKQITRQLEVDVMTFACKAGLRQCQEPAKKYFELYITNRTKITPDFQQLVYSTGAKGAKEDVLSQMLHMLKSSYDPMERKTLLTSIMGSGNEKYIEKLLKLAMHNKVIKRQDFFIALGAASSANKDFTWSFYRNNYQLLIDTFGEGDRHLASSIVTVASKYSTGRKLEEVKQFLNEHKESKKMSGRKVVLEKIRDNIAFKERMVKGTKKYFKMVEKMRNERRK